MPENIIIEHSDEGKRLDVFLALKTGITRSQIQKLVEQGRALVNGKTAAGNYRIKQADVIIVSVREEQEQRLIPENIPVEILFRDEHLVVVNKPAGMVVYPAAGHPDGTLMNALAFRCEKLSAPGGPLRPGIVHRLDKDTSGVMVIALSDIAYYSLVEQFRERTISRKYLTLVYGQIKEDAGEISMKIGRSESDRKKMSTRVKKGKEAVTRWKVIGRLPLATIIEARLGTGRTHQIRVHFASVGHPVLGDKVYGKKSELQIRAGRKTVFPRQMLHAEVLGFIHPATGEYMEFSSALPEDMKGKIQEMEQYL